MFTCSIFHPAPPSQFGRTLSILAALSLVLSASSEERGPAGDDAIKLGLLAVAQDENRAKITSFRLTMTEHLSFTAPNQAGEVEQYERVTSQQQYNRGSASCVYRQNKTEIAGAGGTRTELFDEHHIVTDTSLAYWPVKNPIAYLYEFDSKSQWSKEARTISRIHEPHSVMRYGFADGDLSLKELHDDLLPDGYSVKITEQKDVNNKTIAYEIIVNQGKSLVEQLTVDPNKGYLITHVKYITEEGAVYMEIQVLPEEVSSGIWFPMTWEEWHFQTKDAYARSAPFNHSKNEITSLLVNPVLSDQQFTCKALDLPAGVTVLRKDSAGRLSDMVPENGELIPREIAEGLKKQRGSE